MLSSKLHSEKMNGITALCVFAVAVAGAWSQMINPSCPNYHLCTTKSLLLHGAHQCIGGCCIGKMCCPDSTCRFFTCVHEPAVHRFNGRSLIMDCPPQSLNGGHCNTRSQRETCRQPSDCTSQFGPESFCCHDEICNVGFCHNIPSHMLNSIGSVAGFVDPIIGSATGYVDPIIAGPVAVVEPTIGSPGYVDPIVPAY